MTTGIDFPFHVGGDGRIASSTGDDHVRDMIHQVLFTSPGERVNRPDFGCGLLQLVFMPNSEPLAVATEFTIKSALQKWLQDVIQTEEVSVEVADAELRVTVVYRRLLSGVQESATFAQASP